MNLAAKAINDAGGVADRCGGRYKVKVTTGDMANSREQAVSLLRQAAADSTVLAVVGPSPSTGYVPMVPVAGQLKIPVIATGSGAPIKEWNPWAFRLNTTSKVAAPGMMKTLKSKLDIKHIALIYDVTQNVKPGQENAVEIIKAAIDNAFSGYEQVTQATREAMRRVEEQVTQATSQLAQAGSMQGGFQAPGGQARNP